MKLSYLAKNGSWVHRTFDRAEILQALEVMKGFYSQF